MLAATPLDTVAVLEDDDPITGTPMIDAYVTQLDDDVTEPDTYDSAIFAGLVTP